MRIIRACGHARGGELSDYKNAFLNLALPFMILTEPAEPAKEPLIDDRTWTLWDKWEVTGAGKETTLAMTNVLLMPN